MDPRSEAYASAAKRFRAFFQELEHAFVERDGVLMQMSLALLSREHVLLSGPPGTAKSQLATAVVGRILDERTGAPSLFARQFTESTVQTDLVGPIDFKTLMETGRTEHFTDEGMLGAVHAFLDEVFDGRDMLLRSTLNLLHERELKQGGKTTRGAIEIAVMTSNRYISEVLQSSRETLLAFVDRIAFVGFVPRGFAAQDNLRQVVRRHAGGYGRLKLGAPLTVQDLDLLQAAADDVYVSDPICDALVELVEALDVELAEAQRADPEFIPTRYLSTRTTVRAAGVLRAAVIRDRIFRDPKRPLEAGFEDLGALRSHLLLGGLSPDAARMRIERETDPRERRQLEILRTEHELFDRVMRNLTPVQAAPRPQQSAPSERGVTVKILDGALAELTEKALSMSIAPKQEDSAGSMTALAESLLERSRSLEEGSKDARPTACFVRSRALGIVDRILEFGVEGDASAPIAAAIPETISEIGLARLGAFEALIALRRRIEAEGATGARATEEVLPPAFARAVEQQVLVWDAYLRSVAGKTFAKFSPAELSRSLEELGPEIERIAEIEARIDQVMAGSNLKSRVMGRRIKPLVEAAFARMRPNDHRALVTEVEVLLGLLDRSGLSQVLSAGDVVELAARALIEREKSERHPTIAVANQEDFENASQNEVPLSLAETLVEIAVHANPPPDFREPEPESAIEEVLGVIRALPDEIADQVVQLDRARVVRTLERAESWWNALIAKEAGQLDRISSSGFLRVFRQRALPTRLLIELDNLVRVFPGQNEAVEPIRARIRELDERCRARINELAQRDADRRWSRILGDAG